MKFRRVGIFGRTAEANTGGVLGAGFAVRASGLYKFFYLEADHVIEMGAEPLQSGAGRLIYLLAVTRWDAPYDHEILTDEQIYRIRENIMAALTFMRIKFESNWLPSSRTKPMG